MGALDCVTSNDRIKGTESTEVFTINMANSNSCLNEPRRDLESQYSKSESSKKHSIWWTIGIDIPLFLLVLICISLMELVTIIPGYKAGFYCNDPALSHTFTGDTVSSGLLMSGVFLLPIPILLIAEYIFINANYLQRSRLLQTLRNTLWEYRSYGYGLLINLAIVEVMKFTIGAPRPTFFDICQPDTADTCVGSVYVPTFKCTHSKKFSAWFQADASHSFPSGHTSMSVHCAVFLVWYLQRRAFSWRHRSVFAVPVLQVLLLTFAAVCSLTRVTDHRHHWWDVLAGFGVGVVSAMYSALVLSRNFSYSKTVEEVAVNDNPQSNGLYYAPRQPELFN